jgi:hypothetical protein
LKGNIFLRGSDVSISWGSVPGKVYFLYSIPNLQIGSERKLIWEGTSSSVSLEVLITPTQQAEFFLVEVR